MPLIFKNGQFYNSDGNGNLSPTSPTGGWSVNNRFDSPWENAYTQAQGANPVSQYGMDLRQRQQSGAQPGARYDSPTESLNPVGSTAMPWTTLPGGGRQYGGNMLVNGETVQVKGPTIYPQPKPQPQPQQTVQVPVTAVPAAGVASNVQQNLPVNQQDASLMNLIQGVLMQQLQREPGYSPEWQQRIAENAQQNFDASMASDLRMLENLGEKYGYRLTGAPELGGQGRSMFGDYFTNRAQEQQNMQFNLAKQLLDQGTLDQQNAIQNALAGESQLYGEKRGDVADQLAILQENRLQQAQDYDMLLQSLGFDQAERQNMVQNYLAETSMNDQNMMNWTNYLQGTQVSPDAQAQLAGYGQMNLADIYNTAVRSGLDEQSALGMMLGLSLAGLGGNSGELPLIGDLMDEAGNLTRKGKDWLSKQLGLTPPTDNNTIVDNVAVPGLENYKKSNGTYYDNEGNVLGTYENDAAFYKDLYTKGAISGAAYTKLTNPALYKTGQLIAAYGLYNLGKNTLGAWYSSFSGKGEKLTKDKAIFAAYNFIDSGDLTHANSALSVLSPWERLLSLNAIKSGSIKGLDPLALDAEDAAKIKGWDFASDASVQSILAMAPKEDSSADTWHTWLMRGYGNAWKTDAGYFNKQGFGSKYDYIPPISNDDFNATLQSLVDNGTISTAQATEWRNEANEYDKMYG